MYYLYCSEWSENVTGTGYTQRPVWNNAKARRFVGSIRKPPFSRKQKFRSIIQDLVVFGTGLHHLNRRDPSCPELPDEQALVVFKTMRVTARYEPSGGISQGCANSHQHKITAKCELTARKLDQTINCAEARPSPRRTSKRSSKNMTAATLSLL